MPLFALPPGETPWRVAIVGAGALGTTLALRLHQVGVPIEAVVSRTEASARALAERVCARGGADPRDLLPDSVNTVICCTPDRVVAEVDHLVADARARWAGALVVHTSGALTAAHLPACAAAGAEVASFHPIQTFTKDTHPEAFAGAYVGIEGEPAALDACTALALRLGAHPIVVPADQKGTYHLACALASNYLVTLLHLASEALRPIGVDTPTAFRILAPLTDHAVANARNTTPALALTGPLVRGDLETITSHLNALAEHAPGRQATYLALAEETLRMASHAGRLDASQSDAIRLFLEDRRRDAKP
ncbi:MAG: DUF2520 domain-containing protein [Rhodothermales bacterium]|nr:DUF2520 domain-containing protein [Rhodothermales bacterium]